MTEAFEQLAVLRLSIAVLLGAVVGIEREMTQKSAGMRTHILVCMGACIFTLLSISDLWQAGIPTHPLPEGVKLTLVQDPGRIAAQIVTGIGFIGGGALLRYGSNIRGVTTAASLWLIASVGMLVGVGAIYLASVATAIAVVVLFSLGRLERLFLNKHLKEHDKMRLVVTVDKAEADQITQWLDQCFRKDVLEVSRAQVDNTEHDQVQLVYVVRLHTRSANWTHWRTKLEERKGVVATGLQFLS